MTAWGDQPPLSRRQVRMNAQGRDSGAEFSAAQTRTGSVDLEHDGESGSHPGATDSVPFDTFPPATPIVPDAPSARFDGATVTGSSDAKPGSRRAQRLAETGALPLPATSPFEAAAFRVRDFRPSETTPVEARDTAVPEATTDSSDIAPPAGRPLTRRELRALEAARARELSGESESEAAFGSTTPPEPVSDPEPAPGTAVSAARPQPDARFEASPPPLVEPPRADTATPSYIPSSLTETDVPLPAPFEVPEVSYSSPAADVHSDPVEAQPQQPHAVDFSETTNLASPPTDPTSLAGMAPPAGQPFGTSPTEIPSLADLPAPTLPPPPAEAPVFVPNYSLAHYPPPTMLPDSPESARGIDFAPQQSVPVGHWSTQEALDDASQSADSVTSRDISSTTGPITSNALVLPSIPEGSDLSVPFSTSTGEVLITGSISLPSTLGTTGAHPARYDHSDLDAMIDAADRDDSQGESAPVRAIRAVSTHTSPRDVIAMSRNTGAGSRLPVVLAITAGAMMVSVTVLVVAGFMFGTF